MSGDTYLSMPDTTSRMAPYRRSIRRLVASTLLFASSLLLVASMSLAQEDSGDVSCEGFEAPEDAQVALDENPNLAGALDSDGNGVACDEDPSLFAQNGTTEETDEFTNEIEDDAEDERVEETEDSGQSIGQARQTPATGGVALLPLAGSALTAIFGGSMLIRRR